MIEEAANEQIMEEVSFVWEVSLHLNFLTLVRKNTLLWHV